MFVNIYSYDNIEQNLYSNNLCASIYFFRCKEIMLFNTYFTPEILCKLYI